MISFILVVGSALAQDPAVDAIYADPYSIDANNISAIIHYTISSPGYGDTRLEIYDQNQSLVKMIDNGSLKDGKYSIAWDGKDDQENYALDGVYTAQIKYALDNATLTNAWGSTGTGVGQFKRPSAIAVDDSGNVYVTEFDNHRVQKFDAAGRFLTQWGGYGDGDGQFKYPSGIAIGNGIVYVVDYGNARVQMFAEDGGFIGKWGRYGSDEGEFKLPHGIAVDGKGFVYVADMGNSRVQKFGQTGSYVNSWGSRGRDVGEFISPFDIAISGNTVYVTDINTNTVRQFSEDGNFLGMWGAEGSEKGQFSGASGIAADRAGHVFVADISNHRVQTFSSGGLFVMEWGAEDRAAGQLSNPCSIEVGGDGSVYVADYSASKVLKFAISGDQGSLVAYNQTNITLNTSATVREFNLTGMDKPGYSTYIIAFDNGQNTTASAVAEEQITKLVNSYDGTVVTTYEVVNGIAVNIPDDKVDQLNVIKNIKYVEKDQEFYALLDQAVPQIGGDMVWNSGYTGDGVKVAVLDTGIDGSHPDLDNGKIVAWVDYINGKQVPYDDNGHGTHCAGTVAGTGEASDGRYKGVAPDASLMAAKVLKSDGSGNSSALISAIDWAVQNKADVISLSLGSPTRSQAVEDAVDNAINAGVVVIVAAGNGGPATRTITCPGDNPNAITVGAVDRNNQIASFSSRGPNYDGTVKPDLTSVGVGLVAAKANALSSSDYYTPMSGTSMATPMTAGAAALLLSAKPGLTPEQIKIALVSTALQEGISAPDNDYGYGRVDALAALSYVLDGRTPGLTPVPTPIATPNEKNNPFTIMAVSGLAGNNSWYRSKVTVSLSAEDRSTTGIRSTYYSYDNTNWYYYTAPITIDEEGSTTISYFSVDNQSHVEPVRSENVRIDWTLPLIAGGPMTRPLVQNWYTGNVTVHFVANDSLSGLSWVTPDQILTSDGNSQTVTGTAIDNAGNKANSEVNLSIDNQPPVTTIIPDGKQGGNNWYTSDVWISFTATDKGGSGVKTTEYSLDGSKWLPAEPFIMTREGSATVYARSTDMVGNVETTQTMLIKIDKTKPTVHGTVTSPLGPVRDGWYGSNVTVYFTAEDAISGVSTISKEIELKEEGRSQSVTGMATDNASNTGTVVVGGINIDLKPPMITTILSGDSGTISENAWYSSNVTITAISSDASSGVNTTEYRIGNDNWAPYRYPITIEKEDVTLIKFRSTDNVGNVGYASRDIHIDTVSPKINYTIISMAKPNEDGWYMDTVIVHFTATDDRSGVRDITPDIYLSSDGKNQTVTGYATDMAGNTQSITTENISIDMSPPVTGMKLNRTPSDDGWYNSDVSISFTSTDNQGKGSDRTEYSLDNKNWQIYTVPFYLSEEGIHTVYYRSYDNAGHQEPVNARNVKIDKSIPTIKPEVSGSNTISWNETDWYTKNVRLHFDAVDNVSGVKYVTPDKVLTKDGVTRNLSGIVIDRAGFEVISPGLNISIDQKSPVTKINFNGTEGNDSWYRSVVTVGFNATDEGTGVNNTRYWLENVGIAGSIAADALINYSTPFEIQDDGIKTIYYRSEDNIGHEEVLNSRELKIDRTPPEITIITPEISVPDSGWYTQPVTVHTNATDKVSGIYSVTPDVTLTGDMNNMTRMFNATDNAGNNRSVCKSFSIDLNPPNTTCTLSGTKGKNGWNTSDVTVTLNATDGNGIGVNYIWLSADQESWSKFTSPFVYNITSDGITTIYYYAEDRLGHVEAMKSTTIKVDKTPPALIPYTSIAVNSEGWYNANLTVYANATDHMSGIANVTPISTIITREGQSNSAYFKAIDNAGNTAEKSVTGINLDRTTPNTTIALDGATGPNGWYASDVKVTFTVADAMGAVYDTMFSFDNANWQKYERQFTVPLDNTQVYYYTTDKAGYKETTKSKTIRIDRSLPDVTCTLSGTSDSPEWYSSNVTVTFNATDGGPSGLNLANYSLNGYYWKPLETVTLSDDGVYNLQYKVMDNAGNLVTGEKMFGILKTPPRVANFTPASSSTGVYVDSPVTVRFDGRMNMSSLTSETFYLEDEASAITGIVQYNNSSLAEFRPDGILEGGKTYTFHVTRGVKDLAGNYLAQDQSWSFTTGNMTSTGIEVRMATPTPVPEPTLEPTPEPTIVPTPTAEPGIVERVLPGILPLVLAFLAIVAIGGAVVFYLVVIRKR